MATNNSLNINSVTPLILAWGGSNATLTASNGGLVYSDASKMAILSGTATANQIPLSGSSSAPSWSTATYLATLTANQLVYASSSNVMGQLASANSATLVTNSSGVPAFTASMTNGQILVGSTGATPVPATITAGTGISITNGAGAITITNTGVMSGWVSIAGTTQTAAVNTAYVVANAAQTTITLPVTAALGSIVEVAGLGAGGWILAPGAGQSIQVGSVNAATSVTSANANDCIRVVCTVANTTWTMLSSVSAGFTCV